MLQKILERLFATFGKTCALGLGLFDRVAVITDEVLPKSHKHRKWVIVGLFSLPVLGAVVAVASSSNESASVNAPALPTVEEAVQLNLNQQEVLASEPLVVEEKIRRGDTIVSLLQRLGVNTEGLSTFLMQDKVADDLVNLRAGRLITVQQDAEGNLQWLRYKTSQDQDSQKAILLERKGDQFQARYEQIAYDRDLVSRSGTITSSLFGAADRAGLPDAITIQLANIFSSEIDFHRELRQGDSFRVVYEDLSVDGRSVNSGRIVAAEFTNGKSKYSAYWFDSGDGNAAYFDENGRSLKKSFLRSPLAFSRITSGFTLRRFHPIQQRWKAHTGVDYGASTGTPIMATANGVVKFSGQKTGYGNVIELKHYSGYSTLYAHMSRFGKFRTGERVKQGEVIGYVGSTGWATGPHLHYEFRINNVPRDPLTVDVAQSEPLSRSAMARFRQTQVALGKRLNLASDFSSQVAQSR